MVQLEVLVFGLVSLRNRRKTFDSIGHLVLLVLARLDDFLVVENG